jgi:hypothetical protein
MVLQAEMEGTVQPEAREALGEPVESRLELVSTVHLAMVGMAEMVEQQGCPGMVAVEAMGVPFL